MDISTAPEEIVSYIQDGVLPPTVSEDEMQSRIMFKYKERALLINRLREVEQEIISGDGLLQNIRKGDPCYKIDCGRSIVSNQTFQSYINFYKNHPNDICTLLTSEHFRNRSNSLKSTQKTDTCKHTHHKCCCKHHSHPHSLDDSTPVEIVHPI